MADKIRHRLIMAARARWRAGPMFANATAWGEGHHRTAEEMPEAWHKLITAARHHEADAKRLQQAKHEAALRREGA